MLDKIKVYKRNNAEEIKDWSIRKVNKVTSIVYIITTWDMCERYYELSKIDPLGKFKKEMEGWWFCKEYVIIEIDPILLKINSNISYWTLGEDKYLKFLKLINE